jgi:hypothetical protein
MGMRTKTIKSVLERKLQAWIDKVAETDKPLADLIRRDGIVTGGCVASMLLGEPINDFDVYFSTMVTAQKVANHYLGEFKVKAHHGIECRMSVDTSKGYVRVVIKSAGIASEDGTDKLYEYFESRSEDAGGDYVREVMKDPGDIEDANQDNEDASQEQEGGKSDFHPVFLSTNAITLSGRIQVILRFHGSPDEIHTNYDFAHCTNYYVMKDKELVLRQKALEAILARELVYSGSKYPVCSIIRLRKFIRRGWKINAGQILKMVMQVSELDLHDIEVLQDQLTGVDAAYFSQLLTKIKEKDPLKVNSAYLVEIIDRMF